MKEKVKSKERRGGSRAARQMAAISLIGFEAEVHYFNRFGRKKLRRSVMPISKYEILPDNRIILYPIGWKEGAK